MLEIRPIMNSPVGEIFSFKACGIRAYDQNLEIHLRNASDRPVVVPSHFDLKGKGKTQRINNLMPYGDQRIEPGETRAFYCYMDDREWGAAEEIVFYDSENSRYPVKLDHRIED